MTGTGAIGSNLGAGYAALQEQQKQLRGQLEALAQTVQPANSAAPEKQAGSPTQESGAQTIRRMQQEAESRGDSAVTQMADALSEQQEEAKTLFDRMQEAKAKADEMRERFKIPQNGQRYGYAAIEAYARIARASSPAQASAAAGYARRQLVQCQAALRSDEENTGKIKAAARQLQKAIGRAGRKKTQLAEEARAEVRAEKAEREEQAREAMRRRQELRHRQTMRQLRERGYLHEATISHMQQEQIGIEQAERRMQFEAAAGTGTASVAAPEAAAGSGTAALPADFSGEF